MKWHHNRYLFFVILLLVSLFIQFRTTNRTNYGELSEMERIEQIRRMNEYPPSAYRLANLLEARREFIVYFKLERNFVDIFDLPALFGQDVRRLILLPLFLFGLFEAIRRYPGRALLLLILPVVLLTVIGHQSLRGPIGLLTVIYAFSLFGLIKLFEKFSKYED